MSSKQKTLFQSWGGTASAYRGKGEQPNKGRGLWQDAVPVIDLCEEEEEEEDILLAHALDISCGEEPTPQPSTSISGNVSTLVRKNPTNLFSRYGTRDQNEPHIEDGNVSVGADTIQESLLPTSIAHFGSTVTESSDLPGFDKQAGRLWIYPTNYPVRDYQYNIVQQCLYKNTMVTLPTGLGKTFIAAVVMYNFYQWYPQGKIVFMAPTKPLVAQQIDACYNVMGIPHEDTAEMTGTMNPNERQCVWKERRVFFLTPQVMTNDLSRGTCPAADVRCLVIDEAHRALGNHAYCQVVRELVKYTKEFRVLALSATPGSDIKAVQQVISNLLISQIELRTEECLDIKPYTHERKVDKIVVPLGQELSALRDQYTQVMSMVVQRLIRHQAIYKRDPASLSKFFILKAREAFRQDPPQQLSRQQYGAVEGDFALALSLYHGYELLQLHGLRSLYNFLQTVLSGEKGHGRTRTELLKCPVFLQVMDTLRHKFDYDESSLSCTQKKSSYVSAHPKMKKLEEVVLEHFDKVYTGGEAETRVMIFSQYRDSVQEITQLLNMHQPRVKAMSFIGQSSAGKSTKGFTQKEQLKVMKEFREGGYNTLISTCVGEEGLDIGDIDLIICFDAHKSPIRLVQRMGRTGRKRQGRIVMLITQGKEEQIYNQSQYSKRSIHKAIMNGARSLHFYQDNPRMLPEGLSPVCHKMFITVKHTQMKTTKTVKAQKKITSFEKVKNQGGRREVSDEDTLTRDQWLELQEHLVPTHELRFLPAMPPSLLCLDASQPGHSSLGKGSLSLNEWMPWQNRLQTTRLVDHSSRSRHLVELMEFIELQELFEANDNQYSLEMENFLNHDDVLECAQQEEAELETASLSHQLKRVDVGGEGRRGGDRRKGRWEIIPALSGGDEDVEEELPVFDVGGSSPGRHHHQGLAQLLLPDQTDPNLTKQKKNNFKVKNESTFLESFCVDDSSDFEEDKTLIIPQVSDKTKSLVERQCSRTILPTDKAVSLVQPCTWKKHDFSCHNESKVFMIPSPPPRKEIKDVFCELTDEYHPVDVASVVSEWYKETFGESVQVRWAEEAEAIVPVSESGTESEPDNSGNSDTSSSHNDSQMFLERGVDSRDSKPEKQTFTSIKAKVISNVIHTNHDDRKCSRKDVFHEIKHVNLLNECDDEKFKTVPVGLMTTDQERNATCIGTSRAQALLDSMQNEDASPEFYENQSRKSLSLQSLQENNSACEVTAVKDCLTFTQAMACVQSSEEHSQALPQPSSLSPEPLTAQTKRDLFPDHISRDKDSKLSPDKPEIESNSDLSPSHLATDRSRELSLDLFLVQRNNHLSENHLVTSRSRDLSTKHLTADGSRECSPNSDILFCEMPSFNLFDDVSDVDISKEVDNVLKLPSQLPCQAASLSANSDQGFHEESEYKTAMCESSQVNLVEHEFDMPHFELNFDLDEDIIPPSPKVSQPFTQKSFNRSQSAPSSKRKLDLYKTQLERVISDNEVAETLASDSKLHDASDAELSLQPCPSTAKEHLITKTDATPKTKHLLSSFPGQVRSSTPKQSLNTFTQLHHPPSPQDKVFVAGEEEERGEGERKKGEQNENFSALSLTWTDISPSSHHTNQGGPSFKTPSRPTVKHRKRFKKDQGSSKSVSISSAASSDGMSTSCLLHHDEADDFVFDHSAGDTRLHKRHTGTASSRRRPKRLACEFLDQEAVLSGDSAASSDELLNSQEDDHYELSFVNDHTQMTELDVDMQAVYLRSVRSPVEVPNRFRLQPRHYHRHVFSPGVKGVAEEGRGAGDIDEGSGDEYEEDSFCVAEGHEDTEHFEEDSLDELENILCNGKRKDKVAKTKTLKLDNRTNRKRIRHFSGSSSEEEFKRPVQDDTEDRTANREDVLDLLCSQRPDPGPRRRKLIVCSSDEETSPQAELQYPSTGVATPHILNFSPTAANLGSRHTTVTCLSGGGRQQLDQGSSLEQEKLVTDMNKNKTVEQPALVEKSWGRGGADGSCREYQLNSTERLPVLNNFNQDLQDFDFVSDQLKNSIAKPLAVRGECRQKERVVVLVDSRELSGAQNIISSLRLKYGFTVAARQLEACDYILSCRLAVDRRSLSDFSNGANRTRLMERLQRMRELYDRCSLIVERDRLKSGEIADRNSARTKYCDWLQTLLVHTNIRLFYTDNQDETSGLLAQLAEMEKRKGMNICLSPDVSTEKEQCIKFYSSIPMLNYANALYLANSFSNIKDFISRCSPACLSAAGQMTEVRAAHIITYIKHTFDLQMLPTRL